MSLIYLCQGIYKNETSQIMEAFHKQREYADAKQNRQRNNMMRWEHRCEIGEEECQKVLLLELEEWVKPSIFWAEENRIQEYTTIGLLQGDLSLRTSNHTDSTNCNDRNKDTRESWAYFVCSTASSCLNANIWWNHSLDMYLQEFKATACTNHWIGKAKAISIVLNLKGSVTDILQKVSPVSQNIYSKLKEMCIRDSL